MDPHDSNFPTAKVAVMTSDTTALMPATARALGTSKLCNGMQWAPCMAHVANLLLLDQLKVPTIASLLAHAKQIARVFRVGNSHAALSYKKKLIALYVRLTWKGAVGAHNPNRNKQWSSKAL
jgi:hypothetical protein